MLLVYIALLKMTPHCCDEKYLVIDEHEGTTICTNCSHVVENELYICYNESKVEETLKNPIYDEILARLNITNKILTQENPITKVGSLYAVINKTSAVSMNEFCSATGLPKRKVVLSNRNSFCSGNEIVLLDKYCKQIDISYKDYTLIKEHVVSKRNTGHSPLTIIAYFIYTLCKQKYKLTIQKVCNIVGISPISIQRYKKYEFSRGSTLSKR